MYTNSRMSTCRVWQCHQKYGERITLRWNLPDKCVGNVCRVQPNEIVFNTPSAYRSIYGPKSNVRKADIYTIWRRGTISSTLSEIDKSAHAQKKKLLTATFTDKAIRSAETFICHHVDWFCTLLLADVGTTKLKNMSHLSDYLVFDIMCDLSFGKSFELKEPKPSPLKNITQSFDKYVAFMSNVSAIA
jgi:cytochrome P450